MRTSRFTIIRLAFAITVAGSPGPLSSCLPGQLPAGPERQGSAMKNNTAFRGDVVFTEVMYDPEPDVNTGLGEYLELYNRSPWMINLEGWTVHAGSRSVILNESMLEPGQFLVVTGLVLPNNGSELALCRKDGSVVHAARYTEPWNGEEWKKEGGWSLESPDPGRVCTVSQLWEYCSDRNGGTPGKPNSRLRVVEDEEPPVLLYHSIGEDGAFHLWFSEPVRDPDPPISDARDSFDPDPPISDARDSFDPDPKFRRGTPGSGFRRELVSLQPGGILADSITVSNAIGDRLTVYFPEEAMELARYELHLGPVADCASNLSEARVIASGRPEPSGYGSVIINEIMFDPESWAPWFVELYNPGPGSLDLEQLAMAMEREEGSPEIPARLLALSPHPRIITPGAYLVVTSSVPHLVDAYGLETKGWWLESGPASGPPGKSGHIVLADRAGNVVDMARYSEEMHMDLLDRTRGVSLERISGERPGNDPANWHSAASIEGYATPGRANSQAAGTRVSAPDLLTLEPVVFSPGTDGYQDLLRISVGTGKPGMVVSLWITDLAGRPVKRLANNHIGGTDDRYVWDGEEENGRMVPEGFYVVHLRIWDPVTGQTRRRRKATGVIYR